MMIQVVLDTNVYRHDPVRKKAAFRSLFDFARHNLLVLHVPYIVEQEFISFLHESCRIATEHINKAIKNCMIVEWGSTERPNNDLSGALSDLADKAESKFLEWLKEANAKRHGISEADTLNVLDAYFKGNAPFRGIKIREDIPDGYIYESIKNIAGASEHLHVVTADKIFRKFCSEISNITTHENIDGFIRSEEYKQVLWAHFPIVDLINLKKWIRSQDSKFAEFISNNIYKTLPGYEIGMSYGQFEGEAPTVNSVQDITAVLLDYEEIDYVGEGTMTIAFELYCFAELESFIDKSSMYTLSEEELNDCSIDDWNEWRFRLLYCSMITVRGLASVEFDADAIRFSKSYEAANDSLAFAIDDIYQIDTEQKE